MTERMNDSESKLIKESFLMNLYLHPLTFTYSSAYKSKIEAANEFPEKSFGSASGWHQSERSSPVLSSSLRLRDAEGPSVRPTPAPVPAAGRAYGRVWCSNTPLSCFHKLNLFYTPMILHQILNKC